MASKYWIKLYHEMLDDPKVGKLRPALRWRFIECLLVAGECDEDGQLPDITGYAWRVRADVETVETDFVQLAEAGILSQDSGRWKVTKFAERQAPVSGAERWQKWNDRKHKQEYHESQTETKRLPNASPNDSLDRIDIDKNRIDIDKTPQTHTRTPRYELPDDATPYNGHQEQREEMVAAIAGVVKTTLAIGMNSDDFERVADALIEQGMTPEQVGSFGKWWKRNGHYEGKPALKSLLGEIKNVVVKQEEDFGDF